MTNDNLKEYIGRSANKDINFAILFVMLITLPFLPRFYEAGKLGFNRVKWNVQNVSHYCYQPNIACKCSLSWGTPLTIEVRNGEIVSVVDRDGNLSNWSGTKISGEDQTIIGLFDQIQKAISSDDQIITRYDKKYGYPVFIIFDPDYYTIDDEHMYLISNFEILP